MRPWRSLAAWILIAGAVHALILLLPRPAGQAGERIPTIELTLEETGPGPAGPAGGGAPAPRARSTPQAAAAAAEPAASPRPPETSPPAEPADGTAVVTAPAAPAPDPAEQPEPSAAAAAVSLTPQAAAPGSLNGAAGGAGAAAAAGGQSGGGGASGAGGTGAGVGDAAAAGLTPPRPRTQISPAYPRSARAAGAQGTVRITALIDATGAVVSAEVSRSSGTVSLDRAALDEVRHTTFQPAVQRGKPVPCRLIIPVRFAIQGNGAR